MSDQEEVRKLRTAVIGLTRVIADLLHQLERSGLEVGPVRFAASTHLLSVLDLDVREQWDRAIHKR